MSLQQRKLGTNPWDPFEAWLTQYSSGSYMGFSGSFSASLAVASSQAGTSTLARKSKKVTIAYNVGHIGVIYWCGVD